MDLVEAGEEPANAEVVQINLQPLNCPPEVMIARNDSPRPVVQQGRTPGMSNYENCIKITSRYSNYSLISYI